MFKNLCKYWLLSPAILGATLFATGAIATETNSVELEIAQANISKEPQAADTSTNMMLEQIRRYSRENRQKSLNQVTNVSQLRDVSPGDWAFEALRSLVERYGCIAGYPDGTFRGNRPLTRYEFAAGLNACLDQITRLLGSGNGDDSEKLETLQRLMQEFEAELATLGTRVDGLEGRVAFLEDNQFSTTTKFEGEVVFGVVSVLNGEDVNGDDVDQVPILGDRVRLEFNTSFTGQDLLFTRLATGNSPEFAEETGTFEGEIGFAQPEDNDIAVEVLYYQFPFGDNTEVSIFATGGAADDFADTLNILDQDGGSGAVSLFGTRNSIYYLFEGAGLGFKTALSDAFDLSGGYLAGNDEVNNPSDGSGLLEGPYSVLGQLVFKPSDSLSIGLTYVHSYRQNDTGTGSRLANFQSTLGEFFDTDVANQTVGEALTDLGFSTDIPVISNSYGIELSWRLSEQFVLGGWGGYTFSDTLSTGNGLINRGTIETLNFALTLGFPDLGKEGSLGGIIIGVEPHVVNSSVNQVNPLAVASLALAGLTENDLPIGEDDDISFHIEAFYQYRLTDNIAITPGIIWITAPNNNNDNDDLVIGTIRTTFSL